MTKAICDHVQDLANNIHVPYQRVNELVNGKRGVTPSTALRLSKLFGNSPEFWLNLQQNWQLYQALKEEEEIDRCDRNFCRAGTKKYLKSKA